MENYLEQIYLNMPEAVFYFSGEKEQKAENLQAYIGEQKLAFQSLQKISESETQIYYYIALDISASIPESEFHNVCDGLVRFGESLRDQDHMMLVTFGDDVNTVFDLTGKEFRSDSSAREQLSNMVNSDQHTLLYEGLYQIARHSKQLNSEASIRKAVYVISDGMDDATGKAARSESLREIQDAGLPLYGFTVPQVEKETVNIFGEYVRATGGYLTMMDEGTEADSFTEVSEHILNGYEATFLAENNRISNSAVTVTLEFTDTNTRQSMEVQQDRWIADTVAPVMEKIEQRGKRQLKVVFSEPVTGGKSAENFILKSEEEEFIPVYTSEGSAGDSVLLTFAEDFEPGSYELVCENLTDVSMEQNALEGSKSIQIEKVAETETEEKAGAEAESEGGNGAGAEAESEAGAETGGEGGNGAGAETESETETAAETEAVTEEKTETEIMTETETATEALTETGSGSGGLSATLRFAAIPVAILILILILLILRKRKKDQKEQEEAAGPVYEVRHKVELDSGKNLENKTVFVRVSGRKEEMKLTVKNSMIVGRSNTCELSFDDPALSRQHFVLLVKEGKVMISNLSTSGFTLVNGVRLTQGEHPLNSGDRIRAGQLELVIRWE